jgi:hypothetical protein
MHSITAVAPKVLCLDATFSGMHSITAVAPKVLCSDDTFSGMHSITAVAPKVLCLDDTFNGGRDAVCTILHQSVEGPGYQFSPHQPHSQHCAYSSSRTGHIPVCAQMCEQQVVRDLAQQT